MTARKFVGGLAAIMLLLAGCGGKDKVPEPKEPEEPYVDPMLVDAPPERSLENQAGLIIDSSPSGMAVKVDGKSVGKTPITVENLASGEHEVVFDDPGEGDVTLTVDLGVGEFKKVHHSHSPNASDARVGKD